MGRTVRRADEPVDSFRCSEEMALDEHRVAQLGADLAPPEPLVARSYPACRHTAGQIARDHRVVDSLGRDAVDESSGVAGQQDAPRRGFPQRPAHRDQERGEMRSTGGPVEYAALLQLADEPSLQVVGRLVDVRAEPFEHVADPDVYVFRL